MLSSLRMLLPLLGFKEGAGLFYLRPLYTHARVHARTHFEFSAKMPIANSDIQQAE
jgi:hypothetical protein